MTPQAISDKYWNNSEPRAASDSAVTRMLYGNGSNYVPAGVTGQKNNGVSAPFDETAKREGACLGR